MAEIIRLSYGDEAEGLDITISMTGEVKCRIERQSRELKQKLYENIGETVINPLLPILNEILLSSIFTEDKLLVLQIYLEAAADEIVCFERKT